MKSILLFTIILSVFPALADYKSFIGSVDEACIQMELNRNKNKVTGSYYFTKDRKSIAVTGTYDPIEKELKLTEATTKGKIPAQIIADGEFKNAGFTGDWFTDEKKGVEIRLVPHIKREEKQFGDVSVVIDNGMATITKTPETGKAETIFVVAKTIFPPDSECEPTPIWIEHISKDQKILVLAVGEQSPGRNKSYYLVAIDLVNFKKTNLPDISSSLELNVSVSPDNQFVALKSSSYRSACAMPSFPTVFDLKTGNEVELGGTVKFGVINRDEIAAVKLMKWESDSKLKVTYAFHGCDDNENRKQFSRKAETVTYDIAQLNKELNAQEATQDLLPKQTEPKPADSKLIVKPIDKPAADPKLIGKPVLDPKK